MTLIQDFIRSGLRKNEWTQAQLARELDSAPAQVSRWLSDENPARPSTEACKALSRVFGVEESEVLRIAGHLSEHATVGGISTIDQLTIDPAERIFLNELIAEIRAIPSYSWGHILTVVRTQRAMSEILLRNGYGVDQENPLPPAPKPEGSPGNGAGVAA